MPTYEYRCKECKIKFERFLTLSEFDKPQICECGSETQKLISSVSFINTGENRPIDSIIGADAEKKWEIVHKRKDDRLKKKLKSKIKEIKGKK